MSHEESQTEIKWKGCWNNAKFCEKVFPGKVSSMNHGQKERKNETFQD
jgi:hypothetical protein